MARPKKTNDAPVKANETSATDGAKQVEQEAVKDPNEPSELEMGEATAGKAEVEETAKAKTSTKEKGPDNNKRLAELEDRLGNLAAHGAVTASDASDLASAIRLVNALKAKLNEVIGG